MNNETNREADLVSTALKQPNIVIGASRWTPVTDYAGTTIGVMFYRLKAFAPTALVVDAPPDVINQLIDLHNEQVDHIRKQAVELIDFNRSHRAGVAA